jgi:hypothetical protein
MPRRLSTTWIALLAITGCAGGRSSTAMAEGWNLASGGDLATGYPATEYPDAEPTTSLHSLDEEDSLAGEAVSVTARERSPGTPSIAASIDPSSSRSSAASGRPSAPQPQPPRALYAQADVERRRGSGAGYAPPTATDAVDTSGPLLIYTATFHLAVYEVRESQLRIVEAAREAGGFVFAQSDDRLVVRVPAPRFHAMLDRVEQAGDVEHREVQAQDVSEEFRDVEIRIRNLEAMRQRVEQLLAQARTVEDALAVEQQLRRITEELELLRGRQRFLADRIAFSTLTVLFRARARELIGQPDVFELPFAWLAELGLGTLLDLRR